MLKQPLQVKLQPESVIQTHGSGSDSDNVINGTCLYPCPYPPEAGIYVNYSLSSNKLQLINHEFHGINLTQHFLSFFGWEG